MWRINKNWLLYCGVLVGLLLGLPQPGLTAVAAGNCDQINELVDYGIIGEGAFDYGNNSEINGNEIDNPDNIANPTTPTPVGTVEDVDLDFPPLEPAVFPATGTLNLIPPTNPVAAGSYGTIDFEVNKKDDTVIFSGGDYYIKELIAKNRATVLLAPGNYFIEKITLENKSTLVIAPAGKVNIYIKESVQLNNESEINSTGATSDLTFYLYDGVSFQVGNANQGSSNIDFNGIIYAPYENSSISFGNNNNITGAILSEGTVSVGNNTEFDYSDALQDEIVEALGCTLTGKIDHLEIYHDGFGLTCAPETIEVLACEDAACTSYYSGEAILSLQPSGWVGGSQQAVSFAGDGSRVALTLWHTTPGIVDLAVTSSLESDSGTVCVNSSGGVPCQMVFADSGFILDVPDGRSCADLSGTIQAVRRDDTSEQCVADASFAGQTKAISFWYGYSDPVSGSVAPRVDGTLLGSSSPGETMALVFDGQAQAPFSVSYRDAGSLNLYARHDGSGDSAGLVMLGSTTGPVVVAPDHFEVTSPLDNSTTSGLPKLAAGDEFSATVTAVCSDGTVTPNFAWTTLFETDSPHGGSVLGTLSGGELDHSDYSNGTATTTDLAYSEVGNLTLKATASGYLDSTMDVSGTSGLVGRFHPADFEVTANSPSLVPGCSGFSYLDQPLNYATQPQLTIRARNRAGDTTLNYQDSWWKLADVLESYYDSAMPATVTIDSSLAGHAPATSAATSAGQVVTTFAGPLLYRRPIGSNVAPFNSQLALQLVVDDGDAQYAGGVPFVLALPFDPPTANELRHGRLVLTNVYGSEQLPLAMQVTVEYFTGTSFVLNPLDNCTSLVLGQFSFTATPLADSLTAISGGSGALNWSNPVYPSGHVDVTVDLSALPWLQFDWDDDGLHDNDPPFARATFGIYKGDEKIIYLRETTWR